jgi:hypothetical protein
VTWRRPPPRQVKLNVDAAFFAETCACATGVVICDYRGQFMAASSSCLPPRGFGKDGTGHGYEERVDSC